MALAAMCAVGLGVYQRSQGEDWTAAALGAGIAFVAVLVALHVLYGLLKLVMSVAKIAVPLALVLVVGNMLDWEWAEGTTDYLGGVWGYVSERTGELYAKMRE